MYLPTDPDLFALAQALGEKLTQARRFLATAESCTGGWVGKVITDVPGSSHWYDSGFITYSNAAKETILGVSEETLRIYGAVSEPVVRAMVAGVLEKCTADYALAISGIAGPGGASETKPVGYVWFAWGRRNGETQAQSCNFMGDREAIRRQAVFHSLTVLHNDILR
jgi:nicotinamide-nucleotide amidase